MSQGSREQRQLPIAADPIEALLGFDEHGPGPAPGHVGIFPALDVATQFPRPREATLNRVRAAQRLAEPLSAAVGAEAQSEDERCPVGDYVVPSGEKTRSVAKTPALLLVGATTVCIGGDDGTRTRNPRIDSPAL